MVQAASAVWAIKGEPCGLGYELYLMPWNAEDYARQAIAAAASGNLPPGGS